VPLGQRTGQLTTMTFNGQVEVGCVCLVCFKAYEAMKQIELS
jgi:hypothetical protein